MSECKSLTLLLGKANDYRQKMNAEIESGDVRKAEVAKVKLERILAATKELFDSAIKENFCKKHGFDHVEDFRDGVAIAHSVGADREFILVGKDGREILEAYRIDDSRNNGYIVQNYEEFGDQYYTNSKGERKTGDWSSVNRFWEGFAVVSTSGSQKNYFIDENYKIVFNKDGYSRADGFENGYARVAESESNLLRWNLIDREGNKVFSKDLMRIGTFGEGVVAVQRNESDSFEVVDINGNLKFKIEMPKGEDIPSCYKVRKYSEGMLQVGFSLKEFGSALSGRMSKANGPYWTYADMEGKLLKDTKEEMYQEVWEFKGGMARVKKNDKWYYIDTSGDLLFNGREFAGHEKFSRDGFMRIKDAEGKRKYMDREGKFYDFDEAFKTKIVSMEKEEKIKALLESLEEEDGGE